MGMRPGLTERLEVTEAEAGRRVDAVPVSYTHLTLPTTPYV